MSAVEFEDHPTDPNRVVLRKKPRIDQGPDYERGFIDGMQYQMQSSVDRAVKEALAQQCVCGEPNSAGTHRTDGPCLAPQRTWVGLTDEEYTEMWGKKPDLLNFFRQIEAKLKEKNT